MERIPDLPLAEMPAEIRQAIFHTSPPAADSEPMPGAPLNPWLAKVGENGVLAYEDPADEERALLGPIAELEKKFHPESIVASPSSPSQRFSFSKRAAVTAVEEKQPAQLTYRKTRTAEGLLWVEAFDAAGVLQSAGIAFDETE